MMEHVTGGLPSQCEQCIRVDLVKEHVTGCSLSQCE